MRITDGAVPRQSCLSVLGPAMISCKVLSREAELDCWTRVLRRSAGWRREAERAPVPRPAMKWKAGVG